MYKQRLGGFDSPTPPPVMRRLGVPQHRLRAEPQRSSPSDMSHTPPSGSSGRAILQGGTKSRPRTDPGRRLEPRRHLNSSHTPPQRVDSAQDHTMPESGRPTPPRHEASRLDSERNRVPRPYNRSPSTSPEVVTRVAPINIPGRTSPGDSPLQQLSRGKPPATLVVDPLSLSGLGGESYGLGRRAGHAVASPKGSISARTMRDSTFLGNTPPSPFGRHASTQASVSRSVSVSLAIDTHGKERIRSSSAAELDDDAFAALQQHADAFAGASPAAQPGSTRAAGATKGWGTPRDRPSGHTDSPSNVYGSGGQARHLTPRRSFIGSPSAASGPRRSLDSPRRTLSSAAMNVVVNAPATPRDER